MRRTPPSAEILIVDDDPSYRKALGRLVASAGYDVRTFGSARDLLDGWERGRPACVVLDVQLPGEDGIELYHRCMEGDPSIATIFLTGVGDVPMGVEAIKSGAFDFLEKPVPRPKLLATIDAAVAQVARSDEESRYLQELADRYESLTPREAEVMGLIVEGLLNKQIAHQLGISIRTVKAHRGRIMTKMGARRLPHLMRIASQLGLMEDGPPESNSRGPGHGISDGAQPLLP